MARLPLASLSLMMLLPATVLAHDADNPPDPPLHVDPSLEDCSVAFAPELTQGAFARFAREFGAVSAFKQAAAPTALGTGHVALGVEYVSFSVEDHSDAWNDTFAHPDAYHELGSELSLPKLRLRVGVTNDLDVGAFFARNPDANYGWLGLEARYLVLKQADDMPVAVAVRGAYTKTLYVTDMDMHAVSLDVSAGRTFWRAVTPYVGLGADAVLARETSDAVNLRTETALVPHVAGGIEVRWWHVAVGTEAQVSTNAPATLQAQVSAVF